jgi:hypothetical protein
LLDFYLGAMLIFDRPKPLGGKKHESEEVDS